MGAMSSMSSSLEWQDTSTCKAIFIFMSAHMAADIKVGYGDRTCDRPTSHQVLAVCQNGQRSHTPGMLSRPAMPHRLLDEKGTQIMNKNYLELTTKFHTDVKERSTHLPDQYHACEPDTGHYLPLWP